MGKTTAVSGGGGREKHTARGGGAGEWAIVQAIQERERCGNCRTPVWVLHQSRPNHGPCPSLLNIIISSLFPIPFCIMSVDLQATIINYKSLSEPCQADVCSQ